jgi:hypothetical protein
MKQIWDLGRANPNYRISIALQDLKDRELLKLLQADGIYGVAVVSKFFSEIKDGVVVCMKLRCNLYSLYHSKVVNIDDLEGLIKVCNHFYGLKMGLREDHLGVEYIADNTEDMVRLMDALDSCGIDIYSSFYPIDANLADQEEIYSPNGELLLRIPNVAYYRIKEGTRRMASNALGNCTLLKKLELPYTFSESELNMNYAIERCNHVIDVKKWHWPYETEEDSEQLKQDIKNGRKDEYGFIYSQDGKVLLKAANADKYRIPEGVERIEKNALIGCQINELDIPYTMHLDENNHPIWGSEEVMCNFTIWDGPYNDIDNMLDPDLSDIDDRCWDEHQVAYSKSGKRLLGCRWGFDEEEYWVKDGVTTICSYAFITSKKFLKLHIPNTVRVIGPGIFGDNDGVIIIAKGPHPCDPRML